MRYLDRLKSILNQSELAFLARLNSPQKIQDYLDSLPINFELLGETYMSVRRTIRLQTAHCLEGALLAAAALAYHGERPLLMDFRTVPEDEDHVVAVFKQNGYWGAMSKTNHAILRYRDPIYKSPRELAASYFHEYLMWEDGRKTLREYSIPLDMWRYDPATWLVSDGELFWLAEDLDGIKHFPLVPKKNLKLLRRANKFEIDTIRATEWKQKKITSN